MIPTFVAGCLFTGCMVIGLFFLRFWKTSRDRLFIFFALAFWLLGANWIVLAFTTSEELRTPYYWFRVAAFGLLLIGIWDKNRSASRGRKT